MRETLEDIRSKIKNNIYKNKEHVRLSLVSRILHMTGWDIWNPAEVFFDFPINSDQVDLALFATADKPSCFFEITPIGYVQNELPQLEAKMQDCNKHNSAMFTIITDGKQWKFYYSNTAGEFSNMCFDSFDIAESPFEDIEHCCNTYLQKENYINGDAQREAKNILLQTTVTQAISEVLPKARVLVNEPPFPRLPEAIVTLINTESFKISEDDVAKVLSKIENNGVSKHTTNSKLEKDNSASAEGTIAEALASDDETPSPPPPPPPPPAKKTVPIDKQNFLNKHIKSFIFLDKTYSPKSWKEMLVSFCEVVFRLHSNDFDKCLTLGSANRVYFSKNKSDLFGNAPVQIGNTEYYVMTNFNANDIVQLTLKVMDLFEYTINDIEIVTD